MIYLQYILPHHQLNKLAKFLGNCHIPWVKNLLISYFLRKYNINLKEALNPDPLSYKNYNDFFTRKLCPNSRKIDLNPKSIISPCDGYIAQYGNIDQGLYIQAKGNKISLANLLANTNVNNNLGINLENFINGKFINIYLAPHNYHRIHMPIDATLDKMRYVAGKLFSVNPKTVNKIPNVFTKNERVINVFNSEVGKVVIILVGAMIVGSMVTSWHGEVHSREQQNIDTWDYQDQQVHLARGAELGYFQLGSTVIALFENKNLNFTNNIQNNFPIKMGEKMLELASS